ncbi:MAG: glycosyltransferase family 4 protein [Oleispira sp.]
MKVFIGMTRSDTIVSGSFKHICQIGDAYRKNGAEVVYFLGGNGAAVDVLLNQGFKVYSSVSLKRELNPLWDIWSLLVLLWLIIKERPDVCSWHTAKIGALGRIATFLTGRKSYYVPHGVPFVNTPENKGYKKYEVIERVLAFLPSKIIGVCEFDRNEYLRIGVNDKRLLVIPNGMEGMAGDDNIEVIKNKNVSFITAARFEAQKDYVTLSKACHRLISDGFSFKLDIYGDGFMEADVKSLFSDLPQGTINFMGVVSDFATRLATADVFVLSSFWEGLPRSIIEAMACEKPLIASDVGGCSELIVHGENGFLVPIRNSDVMYEAMKSYIQSPESIKNHGVSSLQYYEEKYTLGVMQEAYCREYGIVTGEQQYVK